MILVAVRSARYVYYQPNEKDKKNKYGDCTIRALSKVFNCSWIEAFDKTIPICRENQVPNIFFAPATIRKKLLDQLGFDYCGYKVGRGEKRSTVNDFAKSHPTGAYILNVANHVVACVDGKYYDTWDSGRCCLYGYFKRR